MVATAEIIPQKMVAIVAEILLKVVAIAESPEKRWSLWLKFLKNVDSHSDHILKNGYGMMWVCAQEHAPNCRSEDDYMRNAKNAQIEYMQYFGIIIS